MSRVLLVSPKFDSEFSRAHDRAGDAVPISLMVPLHLATVAALTPDDFEVDIWDEAIRGELHEESDLKKDYDLVAVTGYLAHLPRARQISEIFRRRGVTTAIGGPGVSSSPETCRDAFDVLLLGEAELIWPRFLEEWKQRGHSDEYRQVERPDLSLSPIPRWDSITKDITRYQLGAVQTTRGCPFDCEFCDVIHLFGRKPRHKPIERVIEEVVLLQKLGVQRIFLADDDFVGDKRYAKELLTELIPVNNSFHTPLSFSTQLTVDLARDEKLMELMADCNFYQALIGLETPRLASLKETNKIQNLRGNLVEDVRKIQSYGIAVKALMIVGFDADDEDIFDEQAQFLEEANITISSINTLKAYPGTPLWIRLQREKRVLDMSHIYLDAPKVVNNIIPKGMTRVELLEGYRRLLKEVRSWPSFNRRLAGFLNGIERTPRVPRPSLPRRVLKLSTALFRLARGRRPGSSLPPEIRKEAMGVVRYTIRNAPHRMGQVAGLLMQQTMDALLIDYQSEIIQRQIDEARAGNLTLEIDPSAGMLPSDFQKKARVMMPLLHERLTAAIHHTPAIPEVMVDVLKDFLVRWGAELGEIEDFHRVYLNELCDRHIERWNSRPTPKTEGNGEHSGELTLERAKSLDFIRGLLVAVEQELRGSVATRQQPVQIAAQL